MTTSQAVRARLGDLAATLAGAFTLRRHEKRRSAYALRLLCLGLLVVVLPLAKLLQLGPALFALALLKLAAIALLMAGLLSLAFAAEEWLRRRRAA